MRNFRAAAWGKARGGGQFGEGKLHSPIFVTKWAILQVCTEKSRGGSCPPLPPQARYRDKIPVFLIFDMVVQNKKSGISSLYLAYLAQKLKKTFEVLVYGHVYII